MSNKNQKILFSHIPKTAGTTMHGILRRVYADKVLTYSISRNVDNEILTLSMQKFPKVIAYVGHPIKFYKYLKKPNYLYLTFLRDPKKRLISQYVHQYTSGHNKYRLDFPNWVSRYENRANWQVRWLGGDNNLDRALEVLEDIDFVGLSEYFDESIVMLAQKLAIPLKRVTYGNKLMPRRDNNLYTKVKNENHELLLKLTHDDQILYDRAKKIYERQKESHGLDSLSENMKLFNQLNNTKVDNLLENYNIFKYYIKQKLVYDKWVNAIR